MSHSEQAAILPVDDVLASRPSWASTQLSLEETGILTREIERSGAKIGCEIGVASGFTSAVLFSALAKNTEAPLLFGFDITTTCYFDPSRHTGEAFFEVHGQRAGYQLTTGVSTADITVHEHKIEFVLIDADHRSPWPALDLLSISRFLSPGAVVALNATDMISRGKWRDMNGPRDLFRVWSGDKWWYQACPNITFLRYEATDALAEAVAAALMIDWDTEVDSSTVEKYEQIARGLPNSASEILGHAFSRNRPTRRAPPALDTRDCAPATTSHIFVVSYGRSGSTLIQKILGSIPGYYVIGENHNVLFSLFDAYERARRTKKKHGKTTLPLGNPWHGADKVDPKSFAKGLKKVFVNEILKPPPTARVIGFKEVRYFEHPESFDAFLEFMLKFFRPATFVFVVRSARTIASSAWWRDFPYEEVEQIISRYEKMVDGFMQAHQECCCKISYDDLVRDTGALKEVFALIGEKFDQQEVDRIVSVRLTHGRHAKRPE